MSELIGRFLSFEDHLGRGLIKFAYYLALFFIVVTNVYWLIKAIFGLNFGDAVIILCQALLWIVVLRVGTELALSILSIDNNLQDGRRSGGGFEAGITPTPSTATVDKSAAPKPATQKSETPAADSKGDNTNDGPASIED